MSKKPTEKDKRKRIKGVLIRPKQQLLLGLVFMGISTMSMIVLFLLMIVSFNQTVGRLVERNQISPHVGFLLQDSVTLPMGIASLLSLFTMIFFAWWYIRISHRFFGPLVPIQRHIENLKIGRYQSRVRLRQTDELGELRDSLNDLAAALEERHSK